MIPQTPEPSPPWLLPEHMIDNPGIRRMLGGIARNTFISWRKTRGFPKPAWTLSIGEVWDVRAVEAWISEQSH